MALSDYILCSKCECKLIYDGNGTQREWWEDRWGKPPSIQCPDCAASAPAVPQGHVVVPDWKGYARFGTGMYVINHTPAPMDPELGAEIIVTLATDKDREGGRKIGESRPTDPNAPPIYPEQMVIRMGFMCPEAVDALEDQLVALRQENFPETQPFAVRAMLAAENAALRAASAPAASRSIHVECCQCNECQHIGINDYPDDKAVCNSCNWQGALPEEDKCPSCGDTGTITRACPECGGHYFCVAEGHIAASADTEAAYQRGKRSGYSDGFMAGRAASAPAVPPAWQPIETAPKDSQVVLLCDHNGNRWTDCSPGTEWQSNGCGSAPTHWMPLPAPPAALAASPQVAAPAVPQWRPTEADIRHMVNRFLGWKLPKTFGPDAGISFNPTDLQRSGVHSWPIGTNLLDATQAKEMLEYVCEGLPVPGMVKCWRCDGDGFTEEGDPEIGSATFDCTLCNGTGGLSASPDSPAPTPEPCPRGDEKPEPTCTNRHQCWEPCGELGKDERYVHIPTPEMTAAIDAALSAGPLPSLQLPQEFPNDERPQAFKEFWGRHRELLTNAILQNAAPGRDPALAPVWVQDKASLLAHEIALAGWVAGRANQAGGDAT